MIAAWATIGAIVGLLLGLTGAGGAIVAIPLFMRLTGASLHEATILSLLTVTIGASLNWWVQRQNTDKRTATLLFLFSLIGSYGARPLKAIAPDGVIVLLFAVIGAMSLRSIWKSPPPRTLQSQPKATGDSGSQLLKHAVGGVSVGALVTLTGLGGGVLLVPLLTGPFQLPLGQATATSLLAIVLTSTASLVLQWQEIAHGVGLVTLLALVAGSLLSAQAVRSWIRNWPTETLNSLRRRLLTAVITLSIGSLVISLYSSFGS